MKILILNTSERTGGAAIAANRLMKALIKNGVEAKMLVRDKQTDDENVVSINTSWWKKKINFLRFAYERWVIFVNNRFSINNLFAVSIANTGTNISRHTLVKEADVIHIHWINQGFLSLKNIRQLIETGKPIVWTMHDMWYFTGICHYAGVCRKYTKTCDTCNLLRKSKHFFTQKQKIFITSSINFVGCSQWIANEAKHSLILFKSNIHSIVNPIDTGIYAPIDKILARQKFKLPQNKKLILFAAAKLSDDRKGMSYFADACNKLIENQSTCQIEIALLGGKIDLALTNKIPLKTHLLGYLGTDEEISSAYAACDIFVIPSLEDNLPNTIMEAMACGTPCVGFNTGGIPEMIDHKQNGYVAEYKNAEDLAKGIEWTLFEADYEQLSQKARQKALECYAEKIVAQKYMELYNIINK